LTEIYSTTFLRTVPLNYVPESRYSVVVCKGVNSPIAAYEPLSPDGGIIFANTAGVTTADLSVFTYEHRSPLYPFETELVYEASVEAEAEEAVAVQASL
jgi:hypothetical protein